MFEKIGVDAGTVWKYLEKNSETSINKLSDDTGLSKNDIHRAIGWLAREGKLVISRKGRVETIGLSDWAE